MEFLKDKINNYYSWLTEYYYGQSKNLQNNLKTEQENKLTSGEKIQKLRMLLKTQSIYPEQVQGKIQMFYSSIIKNDQFKSFYFTTQIPSQHSIPKVIPSRKLITFYGTVLVQLGALKCPLLIEILFQQDFMLRNPCFYVRNPVLESRGQNGQKILIKVKPNVNYVQIVQSNKFVKDFEQKTRKVYAYKAKKEGVEVILGERKEGQKLDVKLLQKCVQMLIKQFPFVKKKDSIQLVNVQANRDLQTEKLYRLSKGLNYELYNCFVIPYRENVMKSIDINIQQVQNQFQPTLPSALKSIQEADILAKCIKSQTEYIKEQTEELKNNMKKMEKQSERYQNIDNFQEFYPHINPNKPLQTQLFTLITESEATKDCMLEVEKILKSKYESNKLISNQDFKKSLTILQKLNQNLFFQRYKINELVSIIKTQESHN